MHSHNPTHPCGWLSQASWFRWAIAGAALLVTACNGNDDETTRPPIVYGALNDTGIASCANATEAKLACPEPGFPQQDGDTGRDAQARQATLTKQGAGAHGFAWTKLGADGQALGVQSQAWAEQGTEAEGSRWSCVHDHTTGLTWEVKESDPQHPRYGSHSYNWYSSDAARNGGVPGVVVMDNETCPTSPCNTEHYVTWANQQGLCGSNDWRLPSVGELMSIAVYANVLPALDTAYFPNALQPRFFTNQSLARDPNLAWYVYFTDGSVSSTNKSDRSFIRLVRGGNP